MKVLVVENDVVMSDTIKMCVAIRWPGSTVLVDPHGNKAALIVNSEKPDIILMELELEVLQRIREFSDIPIIIISVVREDIEKVKALELGADDYIVKPFSHTELLARMRGILRRATSRVSWNEQNIIGGPSLSVDLSAMRVTRDGKEVSLTTLEWNFMSYMARNASKVIPHGRLGDNVWGPAGSPNPSAIKMVVHRVREKLGDDPRHPRIIHSHRGQGYSLTLPES